jgi:hypothetical protein
MEFNTYDYVEPEFKEVIVTSEYAAQHFHRMGWMWGRLEVMREQQTWGALREQRVEKELREKIALEVATLQNWTDDTGATVMFKDRVLNTIRNGL